MAQRDLLDHAGMLGDLHHVAGADLILEQQEKAVKKSFTRLCAPKPTARPTTPAAPSTGASAMPSSDRISMNAITPTPSATR